MKRFLLVAIVVLVIISFLSSGVAGYLLITMNNKPIGVINTSKQDKEEILFNNKLTSISSGDMIFKKIDNSTKDIALKNNINRVSTGITGDYDEFGVDGYDILKEDVYKMYYTGFGGENASKRRLLYAESTDGQTWVKEPSNIIIDIGNGFDSVANPTVLKDGDIYKMWFVVNKTVPGWDMYMATSTDGVKWEVVNYETPAVSDTKGTEGRLPRGSQGKGDSNAVLELSAVKVGNEIYMYYVGFNGKKGAVYLATSSDGGYTWVKKNNAVAIETNTVSTNGTLPPGLAGSGDEKEVRDPEVLLYNNKFVMIYATEGTVGGLFCATSTDGLTWTKINNQSAINSQNDFCRLKTGGTNTADSLSLGKPRFVLGDEQTGLAKLYYLGLETVTVKNKTRTILSADIFIK